MGLVGIVGWVLLKKFVGFGCKSWLGLAVKVCMRIKVRLNLNFATVFGLEKLVWFVCKIWFGLFGKVGLGCLEKLVGFGWKSWFGLVWLEKLVWFGWKSWLGLARKVS